MGRETALGAGRHLVLEADVRKGAAQHDFVIGAPAAINVEILGCHTEALQILARRNIDRNGANR